MSCGCVPLVSSLECFSDFIEDGVNGFQDKIDTKPLENSLLKAFRGLLDHAELEQMSEQAYCTAQDYKVEKVAIKYLTDFEKFTRQIDFFVIL